MAPRNVPTGDANDTGMDILRESGVLDEATINAGEGDDNDLGDNESGDDQDDGDDGQHDDLNQDDLEPEPEPEPEPQRRQPRNPDPASRQQNQQQNLLRQQQNRQFNGSQPLKKDAKGNILDGQGKIVARAGSEARFYESIHTQAQQTISRIYRDARGQLTHAENKYKEAARLGLQIHNEMQALQQQNAAVAAFQLQPTELVQAASLFKRAQTEPLVVLKELLTLAATRGVDLTQLGLQAGSHDPKALMDLMRSEMGRLAQPITEQNQRQRQQSEDERLETEAREQATRTVNSFFSQNPDALPYGEIFQGVLEQYPTMPLSEIWARIQLNELRNGRSLTTQRQQRRANSQNRKPRNWVPSRSNGPAPMRGNGEQPPNNRLAPVTMSYEQIVKDLVKGL